MFCSDAESFKNATGLIELFTPPLKFHSILIFRSFIQILTFLPPILCTISIKWNFDHLCDHWYEILCSNFDGRNKQLECSLNHFQISIIQIMELNPLLNCYEISIISNFDQAGEARSKFWFSNFEDRNFESFRSEFWFSNSDNRNFKSFH